MVIVIDQVNVIVILAGLVLTVTFVSNCLVVLNMDIVTNQWNVNVNMDGKDIFVIFLIVGKDAIIPLVIVTNQVNAGVILVGQDQIVKIVCHIRVVKDIVRILGNVFVIQVNMENFVIWDQEKPQLHTMGIQVHIQVSNQYLLQQLDLNLLELLILIKITNL